MKGELNVRKEKKDVVVHFTYVQESCHSRDFGETASRMMLPQEKRFLCRFLLIVNIFSERRLKHREILIANHA